MIHQFDTARDDAVLDLLLERQLSSDVSDVWSLWTSAPGIESWWGPEGFTVSVLTLELRPGGQLRYIMTATAPETVAFMERTNMPVSTEVTITFLEVVERRRLRYLNLVDFVPGTEPYEVTTQLDLLPSEGGTKLLLSFERYHDQLWTDRAMAGWQSELNKLERVLSRGGH